MSMKKNTLCYHNSPNECIAMIQKFLDLNYNSCNYTYYIKLNFNLLLTFLISPILSISE